MNAQILGWPAWMLGGICLVGYAMLMLLNPVRSSLRDGRRCLARYREIWIVLAVLGLAYAAWHLGLRVAYLYMLPEGDGPIFQWRRAWFLPEETHREILKGAVLPTLESVAGIFNSLVTTFPVATLAAILLLANWEGHYAVLRKTLRKRFGPFGWVLFAFITVCAVAAIAKPLLYLLLPLSGPYLRGLDAVRISFGMDWLAFLFEYLFGVFIQIYLILLVYVWIRGMTFTHTHLLDFAIRRFGFVIKWSCIVLAISTVAIDMPRILSIVPPFAGRLPEYPDVMEYVVKIARPGLAIFLILFATVQITLTFHSERLREALSDHARFAGRWMWRMGWFLIVAFIHFYILHIVNAAILLGFGEGTAISIVWSFVYPIVAAIVGGWLLASWVCLFKTCETGDTRFEQLVKY